jgi:catalase
VVTARTLGVQTFPDTEEGTFEGIDLLDPTKIVPEELAPVQPIGKMALHANPTNYFAETEQVAYNPGHVVPGIEATNDPLLPGRNFSYLDTQPAMFYASLSDVEKTHTIEAYTFELGKVYEQEIKERTLGVLAKIDSDLCEKVAAGLGLPVPDGKPVEHLAPSPGLAQVKPASFPIAGRQVGLVAGADADLAGIAALRSALEEGGAQVKVIAPHGGTLGEGKDQQVVERTVVTARSIEFDAVVVADGAPKDSDIKSVVLLQEAYRQLKPFAAWGDGAQVLTSAGIDVDGPGVLTGKTAKSLVAALGRHRVWEREELVTASAVPNSS